MNTDRLLEALEKKFQAPKSGSQIRRIVFWYDPEGDFQVDIFHVIPEGVKLLVVDQNTFEVKKTLEHDDLKSDFLVYLPMANPQYRQNYLLDIELYSDSFTADQASLVMDELALTGQHLKKIIQDHLKFFQNKERLRSFQRIAPEIKDEETLRRVLLAVLAGEHSLEPSDIIKGLLLDGLDEEENDSFKEITRLNLKDYFWEVVELYLGYKSQYPSLLNLFRCLALTATCEQARLGEYPAWKSYILPKEGRSKAFVFVDQWMSHEKVSGQYEVYAERTWQELELGKEVQNWKEEPINKAGTFERFDQIIIQRLIDGILNEEENEELWEQWISKRQRGHWWKKYQGYYSTLRAAMELFHLKRSLKDRFKEKTARDMVDAYRKEYSRFDRLYRDFYTAYKQLSADGFAPLVDRVEDVYTNWFLPNLLNRWEQLVENELAENWFMGETLAQQNFFQRHLGGILDDKNKVFVLISDGMRYEVAEELMEELEKETRSTPELNWVLGCIPSYTELCMAALLPNKKLNWENNKVCVDGIPATSENRGKILKAHFPESKAIRFEELMNWSRQQARQELEGIRVVYVYHNQIDVVADKASTEDRTFLAVQDAIDDLKKAVSKICNQLNTTHVLITADHGFLFQQKPLPATDKLSLESLDSVAKSRRFVVTDSKQNLSGTVEISLDYLLGKGSGMSVYVPRGNNRFNYPGGARYVHGGASLQEVVVPVLHYVHARKDRKGASESRKVEVKLTNTEKRITDSRWKFHFFQEGAVEGKVLPRTLSVALWKLDGEEKKVSTEERMVADKTSDKASERQTVFSLTLNPQVPNGEYHLRLIDEETQIEYARYAFQVSLAFGQINFF
jgi:uncharacterized protein (TIGR02687 family)